VKNEIGGFGTDAAIAMVYATSIKFLSARLGSKDQLSYSKWNRSLQEPIKKKN
jgi:hypothetical protein